MSELRDTRETVQDEYDYAVFDHCIDQYLGGREDFKLAVAKYLGLTARIPAQTSQEAAGAVLDA